MITLFYSCITFGARHRYRAPHLTGCFSSGFKLLLMELEVDIVGIHSADICLPLRAASSTRQC